jgi:hypothetical protein
MITDFRFIVIIPLPPFQMIMRIKLTASEVVNNKTEEKLNLSVRISICLNARMEVLHFYKTGHPLERKV